MRDERVDKLAEMLVNYSVGVKPGQKVLIRGGSAGQPLILATYASVLKAGGHPVVLAELPGIEDAYFNLASEAQLQFVHPVERQFIETYDARISIISDSNTKSLSQVDPQKKVIHSRARTDLMKTFMERSAKGELMWTVTLFPTNAHAQDAEMSLEAYEDFVFNACMPDLKDPIGYWTRFSEKQQKVVEWLKGKKEIRVKAPGTDLKLSVEGRIFINCDCHANVPDGEIFTGPVEASVEGYVSFSYPAIYGGREVEGVRLWFEEGRVVKATASKNENFLQKTLETDDGARRVGEFAIGTNEGIQKFTREILFDEKIGGSFHMALGAGYPETGSQNQSAIHWDMICDLREGGEILVDDELFYRNGKFIFG